MTFQNRVLKITNILLSCLALCFGWLVCIAQRISGMLRQLKCFYSSCVFKTLSLHDPSMWFLHQHSESFVTVLLQGYSLWVFNIKIQLMNKGIASFFYWGNENQSNDLRKVLLEEKQFNQFSSTKFTWGKSKAMKFDSMPN